MSVSKHSKKYQGLKGEPIFSDEDCDLYNLRWGDNLGYMRSTTKPQVYAHHLVADRMGLQYDRLLTVIDHINQNKYDNRRDNLRVATRAENIKNSTKHKPAIGIYKLKKPWRACVYLPNRKRKIKAFATKQEAIIARQQMLAQYKQH